MQRSQTTSAPQVPGAARGRRRRTRGHWTAMDLSLIAVFAALVAAFALIPAIPMGAVGVQLTLQTLAIALTGMLLGPTRGFAAVALYVLVGLAGLPVLAGFSGGVGVLAGPSAGYLLAFPLAAGLIGLLSTIIVRRTVHVRGPWLFAAGLAGSVVFIHPLGILGMMLTAKLDLPAAFAADLVFWPGDVIKNVLAVIIALSVLKAFPRMLTRSPR